LGRLGARRIDTSLILTATTTHQAPVMAQIIQLRRRSTARMLTLRRVGLARVPI
jgi:hypothetical protein